MQIQRIQSNNTNFGYNPLVNAKLMHDLSNAKKNKAFCDFLKNLCSITNQTELKLREAEKKRMPQLTERLAGAFLPIKVVVTDLIDEIFPNYNYKQKELDTYSEEVVARNLEDEPRHWMNALVKFLHEDVSDDEVQAMAENAEYLQNQEADAEEEGSDFYNMLKTLFPGATIVSTSIGRINDDDEIDEIENSENSNNVNITETGENNTSKKEMINLGKTKVVEYNPEGNALKGFDGLGGMKELKAELTDKVIDFLKDPIQAKMDAEDYGTKLPKGLLLYGPPGCGKTTVLKHLSVEAGVPMLQLETGTLKGSYIHESSQYIDAAFEYAYSIASPEKPVIMMIDDGDAFFVSRDDHTKSWEAEEMTSFLNKIQEAPTKNVMIALTTNKYDIMDPAIRRRFDTQVYVGLPDEEARVSLLKHFLNQNKKAVSLANNDEAIRRLAKQLDSFPISAIEDMTSEACDIPKKEAKSARLLGKIIRRDVTEEDFNKVIAKTENQNKKIKERDYKTKATRPSIGFQGGGK